MICILVTVLALVLFRIWAMWTATLAKSIWPEKPADEEAAILMWHTNVDEITPAPQQEANPWANHLEPVVSDTIRTEHMTDSNGSTEEQNECVTTPRTVRQSRENERSLSGTTLNEPDLGDSSSSISESSLDESLNALNSTPSTEAKDAAVRGANMRLSYFQQHSLQSLLMIPSIYLTRTLVGQNKTQ